MDNCTTCANYSVCIHKEYYRNLIDGINGGLENTPFNCDITCEKYFRKIPDVYPFSGQDFLDLEEAEKILDTFVDIFIEGDM